MVTITRWTSHFLQVGKKKDRNSSKDPNISFEIQIIFNFDGQSSYFLVLNPLQRIPGQ